MIFSGLSSASNDNARLVVEDFLGSLNLFVVCCCKLDLLVDGRDGKFDLSSKLGELGWKTDQITVLRAIQQVDGLQRGRATGNFARLKWQLDCWVAPSSHLQSASWQPLEVDPEFLKLQGWGKWKKKGTGKVNCEKSWKQGTNVYKFIKEKVVRKLRSGQGELSLPDSTSIFHYWWTRLFDP